MLKFNENVSNEVKVINKSCFLQFWKCSHWWLIFMNAFRTQISKRGESETKIFGLGESKRGGKDFQKEREEPNFLSQI